MLSKLNIFAIVFVSICSAAMPDRQLIQVGNISVEIDGGASKSAKSRCEIWDTHRMEEICKEIWKKSGTPIGISGTPTEFGLRG